MDTNAPFILIFKANRRYEFVAPIGKGAYGYVCSAHDTHTNSLVAIKRISSLNNSIILIRTLREIQLLKHFNNHPNIIKVLTCLKPENSKNFEEIYVIQECMQADLHFVIHSKQCLTESHIKYLTYQMLNGLDAIHKAGVIHRDLKPSNCLVNDKCQLKICDFGLARENDLSGMTNYVQTRWYRAPELLFKKSQYTRKVDMWSVGCIFLELVKRRVFLQGRNTEDQIRVIFSTLGTPSQEMISEIPDTNIRIILQSWETFGNIDFEVFLSEYKNAFHFVKSCLSYDENERMDACEAMKLEYFKEYNKDQVENVIDVFSKPIPEKFDYYNMKKMLYNEIIEFYRDELIEKTAEINDLDVEFE